MFGKIKKYLSALAIWALATKTENAVAVLPAPVCGGRTGKGRNKQPHRFTGVAAAKRAARKARRKAK